jgi:hypothetical protein
MRPRQWASIRLRLLGTAEVEDQRCFTYKQEGDETKASIHNATKYALNCASLQAHVVALGVAVVVGLISPSVAKEMYTCALL